MRWVWRGESGAFKTEYAALIMLVAAVVTVVVVATGTPSEVRTLYYTAMCQVAGDEDCEEDRVEAGPPEEDSPDGDSPGNDDSDEETDGADEGSPDGEGADDPDGDSEGSEDDEESGASQSEPDWEAEQAMWDAHQDLEDAKEEEEQAEADYDELGEELIQLISEIVGIDDARSCVTEGDIVACLWTVIGFSPWGKGAKLVKRVPRILNLASRWRTLRNARNTARTNRTNAEGALDRARTQCRTGGGNSFLGTTPVLLADGTRVAIADVSTGDLVVATNPATGETRAEPVTATIVGAGDKNLVDIWILTPGGAERVTATDGHPFWVGDTRWTDAEDLEPGDRLSTPGGSPATVAAVTPYTQHQTVYNLSVAGAHTYYVAAGDQNVLVHNTNGCNTPRNPDEYKKGPTNQNVHDVKDEITRRNGTPPQGHKGGKTFSNDGSQNAQVLPKTDADGNPVTYTEYDVHPKVKGQGRGAERLVKGSDGSWYYTDDHYQSFYILE